MRNRILEAIGRFAGLAGQLRPSRIIAAAVLSILAVPATAMTMVVGGESVTIADLAPGSRTVLFGVGREPLRYQSSVRRWTEVLSDDDGDGIVRFSAAVTNKSIWVAVDLETGDSVTATGPDYPRREITSGFSLKRNNIGQLSKLENARGVAELLIVRPRRGAWRLSATKNSQADEAQENPASMRVDASAFRSVKDVISDDFRQLERGDVIAMIDPSRMEFYVLRVKEE